MNDLRSIIRGVALGAFILLQSFITYAQECTNPNFESGDLTGWCGGHGNETTGGIEITTTSCTSSTITGWESVTDNPSSVTDNKRIKVLSSGIDPVTGLPVVYGGSGYSVRIGNSHNGKEMEELRQTYEVDETNHIFTFNYLVVLEDPEHAYESQPYFRVYLWDETAEEIIECSEFLAVAGFTPGFTSTSYPTTLGDGTTTIQYKGWSSHSINLLDYVDVDDEVTIVMEVRDCAAGAHFGYAYVDASCLNLGIETIGTTNCLHKPLTFMCSAIGSYVTESYEWKFYDATESTYETKTDAMPTHTYTDPGSYLVELVITEGTAPDQCVYTFQDYIELERCYCDCAALKLNGGDEYWMSAWVKVDEPLQVKTYDPEDHKNDVTIDPGLLDDAYIKFYFSGAGEYQYFFPDGEIIDGWQRIVGKVTVPLESVSLAVHLNSDESYDTYFDDIRIHPFNGSMKSYVYDGETFWLTSELDDNNYATFYEYDEEGGLIRIKKETARGIVTIQETRSNTIKSAD